MHKKHKKFVPIWTILIFSILSIILIESIYSAVYVGKKLWNVRIRDSNDKPSWIPWLGKSIVGIMYIDPDKDKMNVAFQDALDAKGYKNSEFYAQPIVNLKDTWFPNPVVRMMIRREEEKYNVKIFTDPDYILPKAWGLGDCDDTYVTIIIGRDRKVKYYKKGKISSSETKKVVQIIDDEIALLKKSKKKKK
jgi:hypothetical protein